MPAMARPARPWISASDAPVSRPLDLSFSRRAADNGTWLPAELAARANQAWGLSRRRLEFSCLPTTRDADFLFVIARSHEAQMHHAGAFCCRHHIPDSRILDRFGRTYP